MLTYVIRRLLYSIVVLFVASLLVHPPDAGDPSPVMAFLMLTAAIVVVFNLLADLAYGWLDPRIRLE